MPERRIIVWVQHFADRPHLMLRWHDPDTGKCKSKSAGTCNPVDAERARGDLEADLNAGRHQEASRMSWGRFRELFEAEHASGLRADTRDNYADTFDAFERLCHPATLRGVTERTVSAFVGALRRQPGIHGGTTLQESTIKVRLQFLRTALNWAAGQKLIPECPAFPAIRVPKRKPQPVPVESFERLLAKARDANMRAFLLCGWLAGLRLNEAIALEREETDKAPWVDPAGGRIVFPAGFVKAVEDQWVPLDQELQEVLDALPREGKRFFRFVDRRGRAVGDVAVSNRVSGLAQAAGVRLTMKSLRRGFGCRYAGQVPAQVLQKLMRHSNITLTMTYYANVDDAVMDAVRGQRNSSRHSGPSKPQPEPQEDTASHGGIEDCD